MLRMWIGLLSTSPASIHIHVHTSSLLSPPLLLPMDPRVCASSPLTIRPKLFISNSIPARTLDNGDASMWNTVHVNRPGSSVFTAVHHPESSGASWLRCSMWSQLIMQGWSPFKTQKNNRRRRVVRGAFHKASLQTTVCLTQGGLMRRLFKIRLVGVKQMCGNLPVLRWWDYSFWAANTEPCDSNPS